jgi:hypothetical protein
MSLILLRKNSELGAFSSSLADIVACSSVIVRNVKFLIKT